MNKTAIITGAGTGIGRAIALSLGAKGWNVVLNGRREEKLKETALAVKQKGGTPVVCPGDVCQSRDVQRMVDAAGERLDLLVHSAGQGHCLTIDELDEEEWRQTLDVSVTGAFLTAKAALPKMRATSGGDGYIVQVCSLASGGTWHLEVGYGTAKGAQLKFALHLMEQLDLEASQGGRRIYSRAVCPGTTDTPFWDRIPQREANPELTLRPEDVAWVVERWLEDPSLRAEDMEAEKPRKDIVIKRHQPFENWNGVIAIAHESHP